MLDLAKLNRRREAVEERLKEARRMSLVPNAAEFARTRLGIELDEERNTKNEAIISKDTGKACVRVIPTNEELMIAKHTWNTFGT